MLRILTHLKQLDASWPVARKMLVGPDLRWGRELLATLARETGGWVGWEAVTPKMLAGELAFTRMSERGVRPGDDLEIAAVSEAAFEAAISEGSVEGRLAALAGRPGLRVAVHDSLQSLRAAGIGPAEIAERAPRDSTARDLGRILAHYLRLLDERRMLDPAGIFLLALDAFDEEAPFVLAPHLVLAGELSLRGLAGRLVARVIDGGAVLSAEVLDVEAGDGAVPRTMVASRARQPGHGVGQAQGHADGDAQATTAAPVLFSATTPATELREVLRRAIAAGWAWGDIEIAATDEDRYGVELHALTSHLDVPCTHHNGLPFVHSRIGRAVSRFLTFLSEGLPADTLREALEAGELAPPDNEFSPAQLAHRLREERVGWGRERFEQAYARLADPAATRVRQRDDESAEEFEWRLGQQQRESRALASLLRQLLDLLPPVPERGDFTEVTTSSSALAGAVLRYLDLLVQPAEPYGGESHLMARLRTQLKLLEEVGERDVGFAGALAELDQVLRDLRTWPDLRGGRPGASAGDALHFTDLVHAGVTGRKATFVVGLDADRTGGARIQDALLPDAVRGALDGDALPPVAVRQEERAWRLGRGLARLKGKVTLSYAVRGSDTGSVTGPSLLLLEAYRRSKADDTLDYDALREHLGEPVSAVPANALSCLDDRDAWLAAMSRGSLLLDGRAQLRDGFPALQCGLDLHASLAADEFLPVHGRVADPAGLDPSESTRPVSASQLETLARCPLAWLYLYGLNLRPPEEPEYDPDAWLSAADRGSLLHEVYERFGKEYQSRRDELGSSAALERVKAITSERIDEWREKVPPPSEAVFMAEAEEIQRAAVEFRACEIDDYESTGAEPFEFEMGVAWRDALPFKVGSRSLRVFGRIDRVDRLPDGKLRVVDFKAGSSWSYQKDDDGPFDGGRHLQAGIYAAIAELQLGAQVERFEYRFPTPKGANHVQPITREQLALTRDIVAGLLEHPQSGAFVPTTEKDDCRYCDAAPICRIKNGDRYGVKSAPRAEWAAAHSASLDVFSSMQQRRGKE